MSDFNVTVLQDTIRVSVPQQIALSFTSTGAGSSVISSTIDSDIVFKSFVAGTGITIDDNGTELTLTAGGLGALTTDDVTEGTNLYFTEQRVDDAIADSVVTASLQLTGGVGNQGLMTWNANEETVDIVLDGATLQVGQETHIHVRNGTGVTIPNGTAVYVSGTVGNSGRLLVAPMIANNTIEARLFIGIATEDIEPNGDGKITDFGKVRNIDTTAFAEGDVLWVSPTTPGVLTNVTPISPNLKIPTAFVITSGNNGTLFVRAEHGIDLHNNHRVEVSNLQEDDLLAWNATLTRWENHTIGDLGLATTAYVDSQAHFSGNYNDLINTPVNVSTFTNDAGYLTSYTETDPIFSASIAAGITTQNVIDWSEAHAWGDHALAGYLTAETDPLFTASPSAAITTLDISNWNTAYGWGDHSTAGYLTSTPAFSIFDATDVNQFDPALLEGQVLAYNQVAGEFRQRYLTTTDISDIVVTTVTDGEVLVYDNVTGNWVNKTLANADIASAFDLQTNYVTNTSLNQTLGGYATDGELVDAIGNQLITEHADFLDVLGGLAEGQVLVYSVAAGNKWVNTYVNSDLVPEGTTNLYFNGKSIDGLTDVDTSTVAPVQDDVLIFNAISGNWEPSGIVGDIDAALTAILGA